MDRRRGIISAQGGAPAPGPRLPAEYQEVEWVGSTKTSANSLPTGITPTSAPRIVTTYQLRAGGWRNLIDVGSSPRRTRWVESNDYAYYNWGSDQKQYAPSPATYTWHTLDAGRVLIVDGTTIHTSTKNDDWSSNQTELVLFYGSNTKAGRIKETEIYGGTTQLGLLVPCYKKSNSYVGWYDLMNDVFHSFSDQTKVEKGADV